MKTDFILISSIKLRKCAKDSSLRDSIYNAAYRYYIFMSENNDPFKKNFYDYCILSDSYFRTKRELDEYKEIIHKYWLINSQIDLDRAKENYVFDAKANDVAL